MSASRTIAPTNRLSRFFFVFLIAFVVITILAGILIFNKAKQFGEMGILQQGGLPSFSDDPTPTMIQVTGTYTAPVAVPTPAPVSWDGAERVTVLVMGLDYRDWEDGQGPPRTDTMILLTIDPLTNTAGILNIPRDLWVNIPGFDYGRINTAYPLGETYNYMGGGSGLAIDTVEQLIGVPINYFAQIDFFAFEDFIDEIGGIEIDVPAEIKVDPIGEGNTVILQPGLQTLDGPTALAYARARNTENVDFDRGDRQRQVIMAIKNKIAQADMWPTLLAKAPTLYEQLRAGVHTNMLLEEAIALGWLALGVPNENIEQGMISPPSQVIPMTYNGQDILKPISSEIRILRDRIFASDIPISAEALQTDVLGRMQLEGAQITVLNGSGVPGLAATTSEYLTAEGANVIATGDAGQFYSYTTVEVYAGKPYTLAYLSTLMNLQPNAIRWKFGQVSEMDIVIFLGSDWAGNNPLP